MMQSTFILSCEHGGNKIPSRYSRLFEGKERVLASHRGWDPGALSTARYLSKNLGGSLHFSTYSRLLIDLNRSPHHPKIFSEWTQTLSKEEKERIRLSYYTPYRSALEQDILNSAANQRCVIHVSVHSFTPVLNQEIRNCEIGLLYDPTKVLEAAYVTELKAHLKWAFPRLRTRLNYPYRGTADGITTHLRKLAPRRQYVGIELELNQKLLRGLSGEGQTAFLRNLAWSLDQAALGTEGAGGNKRGN